MVKITKNMAHTHSRLLVFIMLLVVITAGLLLWFVFSDKSQQPVELSVEEQEIQLETSLKKEFMDRYESSSYEFVETDIGRINELAFEKYDNGDCAGAEAVYAKMPTGDVYAEEVRYGILLSCYKSTRNEQDYARAKEAYRTLLATTFAGDEYASVVLADFDDRYSFNLVMVDPALEDVR
jgi:hypothetical protein